ncbi:MAG: DNA primase [Euryarchaeota archaeon]|nr:DNA primase [Euryarchaeota archaeon]MDE1835846.1 DNA primase [Euryarchaeota archaeon]MDE1880503.1 DNA primase [Euryarchaeota archaeon]MDE2045820.1 DNA primase [Thermoplasmata archaeon]
MNVDPTATKYMIRARITADGVIEKPDVVGAVFGQTEGLLGEELDLRDLQKSGRVGRIEVEIDSRKGKSEGEVLIPSSLDQVETAILASGLETVDRIGPCKARIDVVAVEDVRKVKRSKIVDRAKAILAGMQEEAKETGSDLAEEVRSAVQVADIVTYGKDRLPAGPNIDTSDAIIVVEGRSDVLQLLRCGIKNVIAVEGTSVPETVKELSRGKTVTAFTDGDRSGELILREMLQTMDVDFVARAPRGQEVEQLPSKAILKCLRNKIPIAQYLEMTGFEATGATRGGEGRGGGGGGGDREEGRGAPPQHRRDEGGERRGPPGPPPGRGPGAPPPARAPPPPPPPPPMSPRLSKLFSDLTQLENPSRARLLGDGDAVLAEIPAKDVVDALGQAPVPVKTLIFDGVVSQRLLDVAQEKGVGELVAVRMGAIGKLPEGVRVYTRADLGPGAGPGA